MNANSFSRNPIKIGGSDIVDEVECMKETYFGKIKIAHWAATERETQDWTMLFFLFLTNLGFFQKNGAEF